MEVAGGKAWGVLTGSWLLVGKAELLTAAAPTGPRHGEGRFLSAGGQALTSQPRMWLFSP